MCDVFHYYREEEEECPVCGGWQTVADPGWEAFFASHPKIADEICRHFKVSDWRTLPHFTYICPECFPDDDDIDSIPF